MNLHYLLHGSSEGYFNNHILWNDPGGLKTTWVKLWNIIIQNAWSVLDTELSNIIPARHYPQLNIQTVDEGSVLNEIENLPNFQLIDAKAFSDSEKDLILGRVRDKNTWVNLPLHRDSNGTYEPITQGCYLGQEPELPKIFNSSGIRLIQRSLDAFHFVNQERWIPRWDAINKSII